MRLPFDLDLDDGVRERLARPPGRDRCRSRSAARPRPETPSSRPAPLQATAAVPPGQARRAGVDLVPLGASKDGGETASISVQLPTSQSPSPLVTSQHIIERAASMQVPHPDMGAIAAGNVLFLLLLYSCSNCYCLENARPNV